MAAFVLASAYLIRLAIDADWLTPERQVGLAAMFGMVLIGIGFVLQEKYSRYASLLPACGIVVLFLTNYGAHLYHRIIGPLPATVGVVVIRRCKLISGSFFRLSGLNTIVPVLAMKSSGMEVQFLHLLIGNFDSRWISAFIQ
jgi:hypothetical protein